MLQRPLSRDRGVAQASRRGAELTGVSAAGAVSLKPIRRNTSRSTRDRARATVTQTPVFSGGCTRGRAPASQLGQQLKSFLPQQVPLCPGAGGREDREPVLWAVATPRWFGGLFRIPPVTVFVHMLHGYVNRDSLFSVCLQMNVLKITFSFAGEQTSGDPHTLRTRRLAVNGSPMHSFLQLSVNPGLFKTPQRHSCHLGKAWTCRELL